jgi:two-component system CheB/CheR fusion protein
MPMANCELTTIDEPVANTWLETVDELLNTRQNGEPLGPTPVGQRKLRVLVADDCQDAADSLAILLKLWGHDVSVVYDGPAAYRAAWTDRPDVLLLDIAMPNLDGYDLAGQLRHLHRFEETLLIAISGYADEIHRRRGTDAGFDHYFRKPIELYALESLLLREKARLTESQRHPARVGLPTR